MTQVLIKPGEGIDSALRRFKKAVMNSGITKEARAHERYEKPSDKKRRELKASLRKVARARAKGDKSDDATAARIAKLDATLTLVRPGGDDA